ncbi:MULTISPECIES: DivIVA domain-containing protein [Brevibacterium]|uniref:DivIVA domain-containing protein n=1 Tax=Brevibacterium antiquum CNRZ 918 TaxID=1255637 RepID=A0A2H1KAL8_9MICO|nr:MULTISPECIES: DivIVA domain-containing protein [Brevibacterium]SMX96867.1 DivIVA domain-containing protein [Brevibacterium antiquum CNRZ 918]HCG55781.1 DivIVA domain-containing protein [Brevibacterium sp.]
MPLWIVIGVAAAIFVLVIVLAATFNVFSAESAEETEAAWLPLAHDFTPEDLDGLSFRPALRGYRMEDVDDAVRVLRTRILELEAARGQQ